MDQVVKALPREQVEAMQRMQEQVDRKASIAPPQFVEQDRSHTIPLNFPMTYDGKTYRSVTITRPTIREWRKYMADVAEAVKKHGEEGGDMVDPPYLDVPGVVYNNLDFLDGVAVDAAVDGFFGASSSPVEGSGESQNTSTSENGEQ